MEDRYGQFSYYGNQFTKPCLAVFALLLENYFQKSSAAEVGVKMVLHVGKDLFNVDPMFHFTVSTFENIRRKKISMTFMYS